MEFKIVIFLHNFTGDPLTTYRVEKLQSIIKNKWKQEPAIDYDCRFLDEQTLYLVFGNIPDGRLQDIIRMDKNIFYFSAPYNDFGHVLKTYQFIGFSNDFYNHTNSPILYGRKDLMPCIEGVKFGLGGVVDHDYYTSYYSATKRDFIGFIMEYIEVFVQTGNGTWVKGDGV